MATLTRTRRVIVPSSLPATYMFVLYSLLIILALLGSTEFQLRFSLVYVHGLLFQPTTFASLLLNIYARSLKLELHLRTYL